MVITKVILLIVLSFLEFLVDVKMSKECKTCKGIVMLFFHHIISVMIFVGGLLFNPVYHLLLCVIVLLHWFTNGRCEITVWTNRECGYDESRRFNDTLNMSGLWKLDNRLIYVVLLFVIGYDVWYILNNRGSLSWNPLKRIK